MHHHAHPRRRVEARKAEPQPDLGSFLDGLASVFGIPIAKQTQPTQPAQPAQSTQQTKQTLTSYMYVTLEPTFTGPIGGYSTAVISNTAVGTGDVGPQNTMPSAIAAPTTTSDLASSLRVVGETAPATVTSATMTPSTQASKTSTISHSSVTPAQSSTSSSSPSSSSQSGLAPGAQAGLAIGIILGIGALVSVCIFCFKRRKRQQEMQRLEDEKEYVPEPNVESRYPSVQTSKTISTAPRLSLRPVTQFLPNLGNNTNQSAQGNSYAMSTSPKNASLSAKPQSSWERPMTSESQNIENPFGNHAQIETKTNPFGNHAEIVEPTNAVAAQTLNPGGEAARGNAGFALRRGASQRAIANPVDYTRPLPTVAVHPPTPPENGLSLSSAKPGYLPQSSSAAAIVAAGRLQNSSVHRVQLDFKPSMDDELELQAGQLIRLLHEYDDGWALCIRLDRSQQGVVPRTCLSLRPVKPRTPPDAGPRGPPAEMRIPQPQGNFAAASRPISPAMKSGGRGSPSGPPPNIPLPKGPVPEPSQSEPRSPLSGHPMNPNSTTSDPSPNNPPTFGHERRVTPPNDVNLPGRTSPNGSPPFSVERKPLPGQTQSQGQTSSPGKAM